MEDFGELVAIVATALAATFAVSALFLGVAWAIAHAGGVLEQIICWSMATMPGAC